MPQGTIVGIKKITPMFNHKKKAGQLRYHQQCLIHCYDLSVFSICKSLTGHTVGGCLFN